MQRYIVNYKGSKVFYADSSDDAVEAMQEVIDNNHLKMEVDSVEIMELDTPKPENKRLQAFYDEFSAQLKSQKEE